MQYIISMSVLNCSDKAMIKLRHAVLKKYGKLYGVLRKEVDIALIERAEKLFEKDKERKDNDKKI